MILRMNQVFCFCLMCLLEFIVVFGCDSKCTAKRTNDTKIRKERALLFPPSSTIGLLAAIALPLNDRKNVFLSYNFEANYNSPFGASDYIPGPLKRLELTRSFPPNTKAKTEDVQSNEVESNTDNNDSLEMSTSQSAVLPKARRSLVTRANLYKSIERKLNAAGYNGHDCLLRAICEAAEIPLGLHNGVLGDIMHIIFTPSTSAKEKILNNFYDAEIHGTINMCKHYSKNCPESIFDWISLFEQR